jgi:hypothetical protein
LRAARGPGHDRPLEAQPGRLAQPPLEAVHAAQLACQPNLAGADRAAEQRPIAQRGGERERQRQVERGLVDADPADEAGVDVVAGQADAGAPAQHRDQQRQALRVDARRRPARICLARRGDQRLDLDEQRPAAFEGGRDGHSGRGLRAGLDEGQARIGDLAQPIGGHLEDADLFGRSIAVLGRAQQPQAGIPVAFERQHHVDQMLERLGPGERAVLGHVADEHHRHATLLGELLQLRGRGAHLAD